MVVGVVGRMLCQLPCITRRELRNDTAREPTQRPILVIARWAHCSGVVFSRGRAIVTGDALEYRCGL